jgi:hypothetical protein
MTFKMSILDDYDPKQPEFGAFQPYLRQAKGSDFDENKAVIVNESRVLVFGMNLSHQKVSLAAGRLTSR